MLTSLSIQNYALIDSLHVEFNNGLSIITGETGAGKSILLGGLSLILGKRADLSSLKDTSQKCVIEAVFEVSNYHLKALFEKEDCDYENQTIIRREILPSGKSRAFINDSPVNLNSLQVIGERLIDIHSQHQTLQLVSNEFQFQVIDVLANNETLLQHYKLDLKAYKTSEKELKELLSFQAEAIKEHDYYLFLLNELIEANLIEGELELLEEEYETLSNVEAIKEKLAASYQLLSEEQIGILSTLNELKIHFQKLKGFSSKYEELYGRVESSLIEMDDIFKEVDNFNDSLEADPKRLEIVNAKLTRINNLMLKHSASTISELIKIKNELEEKVSITENLDDTIQKKQTEINSKAEQLNTIANKIHQNRENAIPELTNQLETILSGLGMPNAQFNIDCSLSEKFLNNGKDELSFLFSANKGGQFNELKKAASGGELSRIMLAIKSVLSKYIQLPTIIFDEIDSGVSGEISNKMGDIMLLMSKTMQVISITHLPQIAAKGHTHFKVYKEDVNNITRTNLMKLNHDERIVEIAQMLGGIEMSSSAIAHAKELLN
ncbi:MAG: DNA repair protein RecN [Flavobacteriales bacterium]|nr:DNA repair protein RecN [Flavobacteriia bacterium]NCP05623.1 DNA repair protein RecN [Flavobacteriales bacterium]PIV94672.1 MAG: DNA repair protein RecN [Flavobacteriaceae bacterium CG17_big_fil_post_rev_8_21_14_2_50_33_15]PIY09672.1 MAG: DNA repair protein RecN [Flavobacteriaceae bacterium CG_4_10_14_3_um_filter_33_47]PJB16558.1 MAG: DNA repair protein RecN [Flavobacteriaceae bacterium CG_4_9_14_3_um_filter_33_16]